jgi:5'-nucleotidase
MSGDSIKVTILHTNDMHSCLEAMSRLSTFAKETRARLEAEGRKVFFFDAGDAADRKLQFIGVTKGKAFPRILKAMGYDLQTLGNALSITYGPQVAGEMAMRAEFPVLAANMFKGSERLIDGVQPAALLPINDQLQLGVIGVTVDSPDIYPIFNLDVPDYLDAARFWVEKMSAQGVCPVLLLTHLGLREDTYLADEVPGIDVIIGGHSHSVLPGGLFQKGVLIAQAGEYAVYLGQVDLELDSITGEVLSKSAILLTVPPETPLDPAVESAIRDAEAEAIQALSRPIGVLQEPLDLDYFNECAIVDLGADVLRERMGAEIGMVSGGLFHTGLQAGTITLGDLNACTFSTANPQLMRARGEQILSALERGMDPEFYKICSKAHRGSPIGIPGISGMMVDYDPQANPRVRRVLVDGQPLVLEREYSVACTDAEVTKDYYPLGYFFIDEEQVVRYDVPTILREAIEEYMIAHDPVKKPVGGRWKRV